MDKTAKKEKVKTLKEDVYHNEKLLKYSLKSANDPSESLRRIFTDQARRIEIELKIIRSELEELCKKPKKPRKVKRKK